MEDQFGNTIFGQQLEQLDSRVDEFIDDLIGQAGGDRDFIIRQLDSQHQLALGTDDSARAEFLEKVSSKLEARIGRIPFDYERFNKRELEDFARGTKRLTQNKDIALRRLAEDEQVAKRELTQTEEKERESQGESLSARGLLTGTRSETVGLGGKSVDELEREIGERRGALSRAIGREKEGITTTFGRGIEDVTRGKERSLEDLKVGARRGAIDQQQRTTFGKEGADRSFEARKKQLERERQLQKLTMPSFALTGA